MDKYGEYWPILMTETVVLFFKINKIADMTDGAAVLLQSQIDPLPIDLPFRLISKTIGRGAYAS